MAKLIRIKGPDTFSLRIVGEASHQEGISAIVGNGGDEKVRKFFDATLVPEEDNPYDSNAVRVEIEGRTVGHLPRAVAPVFRARLAEAGIRIAPVLCRAVIEGGADRLGISVDLPVTVGPIDAKK